MSKSLAIVMKDGFIFMDVTDKAKEIFNSGLFDLYILHGDDSESLVTNRDKITKAILEGKKIGIEVGVI
jgi:hypothetical protein